MSTVDSAPVTKLRRCRPLLLTCEAIGWVHMIEKADSEFLWDQGGRRRMDYPPVWEQVLPTVTDLSWLRRELRDSRDDWPKDDVEFLTRHRSASLGGGPFLSLLRSAHGIVSGIEKNYPSSNSVRYLKQDVTHLWRTSPFGYHERNLLVDPPPILRPGGRDDLFNEIERIFGELEELVRVEAAESNSHDDAPLLEGWSRWRSRAIGHASPLRSAFLETLAETRVPNHDLTLWDQSYMTAALFKSAVAAYRLASSYGTKVSLSRRELRWRTRWCILVVGIGTQHYEERAVRIGDWTGARATIESFFDEVCTYVETDLAVGSLIYRDDETLAFTFPGEWFEKAKNEESGSEKENGDSAWKRAYARDLQGIRNEIEVEVLRLAEYRDLETPPVVYLSEPTRSLVPMAAALTQARSALASPFHNRSVHRYRVQRGSAKAGHTCPVCQVRANGDPSDKQAVCQVCADRREERLDAWQCGEVEGDTIWISEVADANDRVALITMSLGLGPWLDGEVLDTLRTQAIGDWVRHNPYLRGAKNPVSDRKTFASLRDEIHGRLEHFDKNDFLMRALHQGFPREDSWQTFFDKVVEDRARAPSWHRLDCHQQAGWLAHQLFRTYAAPGRIHRFWRATQDFFERLLLEAREIASRDENRWRTRRRTIEAQGGSWRHRRTYHGTIRGAPIGLVYLEKTGLVTITNLARVFEATDDDNTLRTLSDGVELVDDDTGVRRTLVIDKIEQPSSLGVYHPVIPLELSPLRFRILAPLADADAVVRTARARWTEEFARVWDRMPLNVGVVGFTRMTPFQAVIEAARNLEADLYARGPERWRVAKTSEHEGTSSTLWTREDGELELTTTPTRLADGRPDHFYLYHEVEDDELRFANDFARPLSPTEQTRADGRATTGAHPSAVTHSRADTRSGLGGCDAILYRHTSDLRVGDTARIRPSRIAKLFLEDTAVRFAENEVRYLSDDEAEAEVWRLIQETGATTTALLAAYRAIRNANDDWLDGETNKATTARESWLEFVRAVLHNELGAEGAVLETLVEAARRGVLLHSLYWNIHVLKEKLEGDDAQR